LTDILNTADLLGFIKAHYFEKWVFSSSDGNERDLVGQLE
jgi:hypothetical protein